MSAHPWNPFRIVELDIASPGSPLYALCEVVYDDSGQIVAYSTAGIRVRADSPDEMTGWIVRIMAVREKPILRESELKDRGVRLIQAR